MAARASPAPVCAPGALAARVLGAADRAAAALRLAADPPAGLDLSALEAPLDKVVAEVAILAREVATCPGAHISGLGLALAREVAPLARAPRIEVAVALRPSVALDLAVGHILLSDIGMPDERLQAGLVRAWRSPVAGTRERLPHRALEQAWLAALAGLGPPPGAALVAPTAMAAGLDLLGVSRDDLYALTHAIAYATDFGRWHLVDGVVPAEVLALCESALAIALDDDDFDLVAELVMAWPCLGAPLSPIAEFAFSVLCRVEDMAGILPSLTLRQAAVEQQPQGLRAAYTVVTSYHTALVMGLACALVLRAGATSRLEHDAFASRAHAAPAALMIAEFNGLGDAAATHPSTGWRDATVAGRAGKQWEGMADAAPPAFRRDVDLNRAVRRADFVTTREVLAAGVAAGVPASPMALQVAQMLGRLAAMAA